VKALEDGKVAEKNPELEFVLNGVKVSNLTQIERFLLGKQVGRRIGNTLHGSVPAYFWQDRGDHVLYIVNGKGEITREKLADVIREVLERIKTEFRA
jgi:hypothetical protein